MLVPSPARLFDRALRALGVSALLALAACGGSSSDQQEQAAQTYTLQVSVSGLEGSGLVLQNNGGDDLAITANGTASFATPLAEGAAFAVTVKTQPSIPRQICGVSGDSGTASAGTNPVAITCTTPPSFAYALSNAKLLGYSIDHATHAPAEIPGFPLAIPVGEGTVAVEPLGRFLYVLDSGQQGKQLLAYVIDRASGALAPVAGPPAQTAEWARNITFDPLGRFVYVDDTVANKIDGFAIDGATGALSPLVGSPYDPGFPLNRSVAGPGGQGLYLLDGTDKALIQYRGIDAATGSVAVAGADMASQGTWISSLIFHPGGQVAVAANLLEGSISVFDIDPTGALKPWANSPFPIAASAMPNVLAMDPAGKFLFVADEAGRNVLVYKLDLAGRTLTETAHVPMESGLVAADLFVDASGKVLYVLYGGDPQRSVATWSIDAVTGGLSPMPGSPFAFGYALWSATIMP